MRANGAQAYKVGDQVLVNVPQNDYSKAKTIMGYASNMNEDNNVAYYAQPIDRFINLTGNLVGGAGQYSLRASTSEASYVEMKNEVSRTQGFTRLGISGKFRAALSNFQPSAGTYGVKVIVNYDDSQTVEYTFSNNTFFGNKYNDILTPQSAVFELPNYNTINSVVAYFFQNGEFEFNDDTIYNSQVGSPSNLFVEDLQIELGIPTGAAGEYLHLYTDLGLSYQNTVNRNIYLNYYTIDGQTGNLNQILPKNAILRFYHYDGLTTGDAYAGSGWELIDTNEDSDNPRPYSFYWNNDGDEGIYKYLNGNSEVDITTSREIKSYNVELNSSRALEQFKVILFYEGKQYASNIIEFTNNDVALTNNQMASIGEAYDVRYGNLKFEFDDNTKGRYFYYGPNGKITNTYFADIEHWIKVTPPSQNSNYSYEWINLNENSGSMIQIVRGQNTDILVYKIATRYNNSFAASTGLQCNIKDGEDVIYTAIVPLYFGRDSGVDYNLDVMLFYRDDNGSLIPAQAVEVKQGLVQNNNGAYIPNKYYISPRIFGSNNVLKNDVESKDFNFEILSNISYEFNNQLFYIVNNSQFKFNGAWYWELKGYDEKISSFWDTTSINTTVIKVNYATSGGLTVSKIVPIAVTKDKSYKMFGSTNILFDSAGYPPKTMPEYKLIVGNQTNANIEFINYDLNRESQVNYLPKVNTNIGINNTGLRITLPQIFVSDLQTIPCLAFKDADTNSYYWSQPIVMEIETHSSSLLNEWTGELTIDADKNAILSKAIGAGRKEKEDGTFSGVFLGDVAEGGDQSLSRTGVYGYYHGAQVYAFMDNGRAFIGGAGRGRIEFDGEKGIIESGNYELDEQGMPKAGMQINLVDGAIRAATLNLQDKLAITADGQLYIDPSAIIGTYKKDDISSSMPLGTVIESKYAWAAEGQAASVPEENWKPVPPDPTANNTHLYQRITYTYNKNSVKDTEYIDLSGSSSDFGSVDIRKHIQIKDDGVHINGYNNGEAFNLEYGQNNSGSYLKYNSQYYEIIASNRYQDSSGQTQADDGIYLKIDDSTYIEIEAENRYNIIDGKDNNYREAVYGSDSIKFQSIQGDTKTVLSEWSQDEMKLDNLSKFSLKAKIQHQIEEEDGSYSIFFK